MHTKALSCHRGILTLSLHFTLCSTWNNMTIMKAPELHWCSAGYLSEFVSVKHYTHQLIPALQYISSTCQELLLHYNSMQHSKFMGGQHAPQVFPPSHSTHPSHESIQKHKGRHLHKHVQSTLQWLHNKMPFGCGHFATITKLSILHWFHADERATATLWHSLLVMNKFPSWWRAEKRNKKAVVEDLYLSAHLSLVPGTKTNGTFISTHSHISPKLTCSWGPDAGFHPKLTAVDYRMNQKRNSLYLSKKCESQRSI